jgi:endonuclease-3
MRTESLPHKKGFDIDDMMRRLRAATRHYDPAAVFVLAQLGYGSIFQILVACILSAQVHEVVALRAARRLFAKACTPAQIAQLGVDEIESLMYDCYLHRAKAENIHAIARLSVCAFGGDLPANPDILLGLQGVSPRCANLALGIAADKHFGIPVDSHVHRITNRWGYVRAQTPQQTMLQLEKKLPRQYWLEISKLLVPFGKHVCKVETPKCRICPLLAYCRQVGVKRVAGFGSSRS